MTALLERATEVTPRGYEEFLASKLVNVPATGFEVALDALNPRLFDWQNLVVQWALRRGRCALFEDCGLGKSPQQLVWAEQVSRYTQAPVLILAPLAVAMQTHHEGDKFEVPVTICRKQSDVQAGVNITNYEMLGKFDPSAFGGVVLDESSILKNYSGTTKQALEEAFLGTPFKLCCTATPSPNDQLELGNHAQFLGVMPSNEMIARWFIADSMHAGNYRLKKHAAADYWRWVSSWAVSISKPSDIGYSDAGYELPPLEYLTHVVEVDLTQDAGEALFRVPNLSSTEMHREKRRTVWERAVQIQDLVENTPGAWVLWCDTDYEADALKHLIPGAVNLKGSDAVFLKESKLSRFQSGEIRVLIAKPKMCGFGLNWQHCSQMAFIGLSYSFEQMYQAVRRCWRFGQQNPVAAHVVMAESELPILESVQRKAQAHEEMKAAMALAMRETQLDGAMERRALAEVDGDLATGRDWTLHLGDSCQLVRTVADEAIDFSVYSPPFSNLYIYSDSVADMGNAASDEEFLEHYRFLVQELHRITYPGRLTAVHCKDLPRYKGRDGSAGLKDFPGQIIRLHEECGWTYHSRVTVWKDPVIEMQRTKNHGLLYKTLKKDSCGNRQGMPDYLLVFRKWGVESRWRPVPHDAEEFPVQKWQEWASPVWMDIQQTNTLNERIARENGDEKHICPLQLDLIERCIALWSNPGELVFSPFAGIGSELYQAVRMQRRALGFELKRAYWQHAQKNLLRAENETNQLTLSDLLELA